MKKTENGWELWSQLGNPTEHLVATEVTAVFTAISAFGLSEARRYTNAVVWHGADTWITGDEIAAGGYFWMTAHPKHGGESFETQGMTLEEVVDDSSLLRGGCLCRF
ncbi:hypothetical protein [Thiolapillus sp.]|uniref:hypothetical protein n=1 Tax=Thiolapillus sp. TaxID=2017437 RepID=UPI003AF577E2